MRYLITAYPYAVVYGSIEVPDDVEDAWDYIDDHFDDIKFGEPELDYCGTNYEFEEDE